MPETGVFGDELRRAREARGVPLDEVASATRIARRYLDALERSDLQSLPAGPFGKGYIRAYAEFLGINPEPILEAYRTEERDLRPQTTESCQKMLLELSRAAESRRGSRRPSRPALAAHTLRRLALPLALATFVLAVLGWWAFVRRERPILEAQGQTSAYSIPRPADEEPVDVRPVEPPPAPKPASGVRVSGSGLGTGIVDRFLVGKASRFPAGTRVVYWTRILDGAVGDVVHHLWFHGDRLAMKANLRLGGSHWRTHSALTLPPEAIGSWRVETRSSDGRVLDRGEFECVESEQP